MSLKPLALVALLLSAAVPTASAAAVPEVAAVAVDSPECYIHSEDVLGPNLAFVHACIVFCPDHTCSSYPWDKDPFYYLPDITAEPSSASSADVIDSPDCWFSTKEWDVGPYVTVHDTCLILCPDHTCSSYPWNKDPWYYLETALAPA